MDIVPMTADELADYREHTIEKFAHEKVEGEGMALEEAVVQAEKAWDRAAPSEPDKSHVMGSLFVDGERVGIMWFVERPEWGQPCLWLYDILIDDEHRGKGYGKQAMALLESEAHDRGVASIGLHVFGHNEVARGLYQKLGFRETSIVMRKDL